MNNRTRSGLLVAVCLAVSTSIASAQAAPTACPPGFLNVAHRGPHTTTDENTISSIDAAGPRSIELELDVRQDSQGQEWLHHDATLDRTTNGTGFFYNRSTAYINSLRTEPRGQEIPTLREALAAVVANGIEAVYLDLWSKAPTDAFVNDVVTEIRLAGLVNRTYIVKFHDRVKRLAPDIMLQWKPPAGTTVQRMIEKGVESIAGPHGMMTTSVVQQLHAGGVEQVIVMSVNSDTSLNLAISKGAEGVMGDSSFRMADSCASGP